MRQVGCDRVSRLIDAAEPLVELRCHESEDAVDAADIERQRDIDQHQTREMFGTVLRDREQGGDARHRRADRHRAAGRAAHHHLRDIVSQGVDTVIAGRMPRAVAVTAQVIVDRSPAAVGQVHRRTLPGVSGLPAAMAEQHRP